MMLLRAWPVYVLIVVALIASSGGARLTDEGPQTDPAHDVAYLFQGYECAACADFVTSGERDALLGAAADAGVQIIWKLVDDEGYGAIAAQCVWEVLPGHFTHWDRTAFEVQPFPGYGWPRYESTIYALESNLLLDVEMTHRMESCLQNPPQDRIDEDTAFFDSADVSLPALYWQGEWHPAQAGVFA